MKEFIELARRATLFIFLVATGLSVGIVLEKGSRPFFIIMIGITAALIYLERAEIVGPKWGNRALIIFAAAIISAATILI